MQPCLRYGSQANNVDSDWRDGHLRLNSSNTLRLPVLPQGVQQVSVTAYRLHDGEPGIKCNRNTIHI